MDSYTVTFSAEFDRRLAEIEQDELGFGPAQTARYLLEIVDRCDGLEILPYRFATETINGLELHSFTHKAHRVFYRVNEPAKTVEVVTVLHGSMRPDLHLKS